MRELVSGAQAVETGGGVVVRRRNLAVWLRCACG